MSAGEDQTPPAATELLEQLLALARREGALEGRALEAFAQALQERARVILGERAQRTEALERENAWRRETIAGLEREREWLRREAQAARQEAQSAREAHERLLTHHRGVIETVVAELASIAGLPFYRAREARRRLAALTELLRKESP